ncbi:MAG TPA: single-stranded-DNA-specific exonuclease RecJ [bacterium]|nr:single-stranded-DNA-specific exonuclease RecJ [bacterium]
MAVLDRPAWSVAPADADAAEFAGALGVHPLVAGLLRRRGLTTLGAAKAFLAPALADLGDPSRIPGMDGAVTLVAGAIRAGRSIAIHGDYDVDGITATAILVRTLRGLGVFSRTRLPHRLRDGYGLGIPAIETFAADGAGLLIAADCGITAVDAVARARALGLEVVVLDHHEPAEARPEAAVVEPGDRGEDDAAPCAAGLAFFFAWALRRALGCAPALPADLAALAALGTVADVVPLTGDNRRLVAAGLRQMRTAPPLGLRALLEEAAISGPVDTWHIGWQIAPRLNAPGRLGDPRPALDLLLTDDPDEARVLARTLDEANRERQMILDRVLTDAVGQVEGAARSAAGVPAAIVVAGEGWHPGVVGLVAGRLVEAYRRPAVAIALAGAGGRGSARSVRGFDLMRALAECGSRLAAFGGHAMAAGLSIDAAAIPAFRECFARHAAETLAGRAEEPMAIDAEVALADVTPALVGEIGRLAPFGLGNPSPVLAVRGVRPVARRLIGDGAHLGIGVTDGTTFVDAIGFSMGGWIDVLTLTGAAVDLAFTPEIDSGAGLSAGGTGRVRLRLRALDVPGVDMDTVLHDTGLVVDRLFRRAEDFLGEARYDGVEDAAALHTKAVGVTFGERQAVIATLRAGDRLRLRREPANPHDPHAVEILAVDGRPVGYLNARLAGRLAPLMDAGIRYVASVSGVTGGRSAVTDAGVHPRGVNVFVERAPEEPRGGTPDARRSPAASGWRAGGARDALSRLPIYLNGGRPFRTGLGEALDLLAGGGRVALMVRPGRGRATAAAAAAAATVAGGRGALVVVPSRSHAVHRAGQLISRLRPLGICVEAAHGLLSLAARDRLDELLRRGAVDVLVASAEVLREAGRVSPFLSGAGAVVVDGGAEPDWRPVLSELDGAAVFGVGSGALCRGVARVCTATAIVHEQVGRAPLTVVDRRADAGPQTLWPLLEQAMSRGEKTLAIAAPRDGAVALAAMARDRRASEAGAGGVGYLHGGLPFRLREIVTQAFREGRLDVLVSTVALDEEALPPDVQHLIVGALAPDLDWALAACGAVLTGHRPVTITLAAGTCDRDRYRRTLEGQAPGRETLAAVYRALRDWRGDRPFVWPDAAAPAQLRAAVAGLESRTVEAACDVFVEAGLATRETVPEGSLIQLCAGAGRRDLATSLRHREGRRSREAFETGAARMLGMSVSEFERSL